MQRQHDLMCEPTSMVHPPTYLNKVLIGCADGTLHLWNVASGARLYVFRGWQAPVTCLAASPALDVVGVGLANGAAVVLNVRHDEVVMRFENAAGAAAAQGGSADDAAPQPGTSAGACTSLAFRCGCGCWAVNFQLCCAFA